jgi:hypothetical protein
MYKRISKKLGAEDNISVLDEIDLFEFVNGTKVSQRELY